MVFWCSKIFLILHLFDIVDNIKPVFSIVSVEKTDIQVELLFQLLKVLLVEIDFFVRAN